MDIIISTGCTQKYSLCILNENNVQIISDVIAYAQLVLWRALRINIYVLGGLVRTVFL